MSGNTYTDATPYVTSLCLPTPQRANPYARRGQHHKGEAKAKGKGKDLFEGKGKAKGKGKDLQGFTEHGFTIVVDPERAVAATFATTAIAAQAERVTTWHNDEQTVYHDIPSFVNDLQRIPLGRIALTLLNDVSQMSSDEENAYFNITDASTSQIPADGENASTSQMPADGENASSSWMPADGENASTSQMPPDEENMPAPTSQMPADADTFQQMQVRGG